MPQWKIDLAVGIPAAVLLVLVLFIIYYYCCCNETIKHKNLGHMHEGNRYPAGDNIYSRQDMAKAQNKLFSSLHRSRKGSFDPALRHSSKVASVWRVTYPMKSFDWSEQPALVADAVEHGWNAFAFTFTCSTCPVSTNFWDMCTPCAHKHECEPKIAWEMGSGSDYMQRLWMNPGRVPRKENTMALVQALQAALPLPGPPLGSRSFPQEGYFEVTILAEGCEYNAEGSHNSLVESNDAKLISKRLLAGKNLDSELLSSFSTQVEESGEHISSKETGKSSKLGQSLHNLTSHVEFSKFSGKETSSQDNLQIIAVGVAAGGAPPFRLPGFDIGSAGFHSSGRVFINGALHAEQEAKVSASKRSWGMVNTTVGCGFDPHLKKIFFTVDGQCVYELVTSSSEFGKPLYPTVAANYDVTVLINFGQSPFEYALANADRVLDPCFRRPYSRSSKSNGSMIEDSGDLFSMGRVDSQWCMGISSPGSEDLQHRHVLSEAESDLFEIVLDSRAS